MSSRVASSIVKATGFGDKMIVGSLEEYEERAVSLALSVESSSDTPDGGEELMALRKNIFLARDRMPLFDTARWVRNFEKGLAEAWRRWEDGEPEQLQKDGGGSGDDDATSDEDGGCIWVRDEEGW